MTVTTAIIVTLLVAPMPQQAPSRDSVRARDFDKAVATMERAAERAPASASAQFAVVVMYWKEVTEDKALVPAEQLTYVAAGLAAADRALTIDPDYVDALGYKGLLLRMRAELETDPVQKQMSLAQSEALRARGNEIRSSRAPAGPNASNPALMPGPIPQFRYGATMKGPAKIKDVAPVYPPEAKAAGISGVVVLEVTVGTDGRVYDPKILRSIPALDQAAIDAAKQWEFTPYEFSGQLIPHVTTVAVNFAPAKF